MNALPDPIVRAALPQDAAAVIACARAFHAEDGHPLPTQGADALTMLVAGPSSDGCVFVLASGETVLGYAALCFGYSVEFGGRDGFVDDLYVAPEMRRRGHGTALYRAAECEARARGCRALHLEVMPGNSAEAWYRALGYVGRGGTLMSKRF